jgi:N-acetylmuramoyl-L-alanine amidase CwlA
MKIDEVPQDRKYFEEGRISDLAYAVDEGGHYRSMRSSGWSPKNEALEMTWDLVYERAEKARVEVLAGRLSPIAYYMELNLMDVKILADYVGLSKWKVKKHLTMRKFKTLNAALIEKYASAFNITPGELLDIDKLNNATPRHED